MKRFLMLSGVLACAACMAPVTATAETHHDKVYHDEERKDDHVFIDQQQRYFRWRHEHSDAVLFKVELK